MKKSKNSKKQWFWRKKTIKSKKIIENCEFCNLMCGHRACPSHTLYGNFNVSRNNAKVNRFSKITISSPKRRTQILTISYHLTNVIIYDNIRWIILRRWGIWRTTASLKCGRVLYQSWRRHGLKKEYRRHSLRRW